MSYTRCLKVTRNRRIQLFACGVAFTLSSEVFAQDAPVVQMVKRNAPAFAIDAGDGGARRQDVALSSEDVTNDNQLWLEIDRGSGYYSYQKVGTDFCIDGNNGGALRQNTFLWNCGAGNLNQHWLKVNVGGDFYRLEKRSAPGFSLDGNRGGANGQSIYLWASGDNNQNQHWEFNYTDGEPPIIPPPPPPPPPPLPPGEVSDIPTEEQAAQFLIASTFGPTEDEIDELVGLGYSDWFREQQAIRINTVLSDTNPTFGDTTTNRWELIPRGIWYERAIDGPDQLRQRGAWALSQIFVASTEPRNWLFKSHLHARYMDIMQEGVFGNFRELLNDVTYSPLMGEWLTYVGNMKADENVGSVPDENYAREIMQLFTIGLLELDESGQPRLNAAGEVIETYDTTDVSEMAKVFTGLWWDQTSGFGEGISRPAVRSRDILPMVMYDEFHSPEQKSFLGHTIPANTRGNESIRQALDVLFNHSNTAPFIGKQLIQRMTTCNPSNDYVSRVSNAFNTGVFTLPDGTGVGNGQRGDMSPVWAAILFDAEARSDNRLDDRLFGKVREPLIRFLHWARLAENEAVWLLRDDNFIGDGPLNTLGQNPFRSRSVFNFYRPGFMAGGSATAASGLVAPELQITTSTTAIAYPNFMQEYILRDGGGIWTGSYDELTEVAGNANALTDHLNLTMTGGRLSDINIERVRETINSVPLTGGGTNAQLRDRVQLAMLLIANSQEYNTQQ